MGGCEESSSSRIKQHVHDPLEEMEQLGDPSGTVLVPISKALYTKTSTKPRPGAAARWAHDRVRDIAGSLRACAKGAAELSTVTGLCKKMAGS